MCGFYTSCFFFNRRVTKVSIIGFISVFVKGAGEWVQLLVSASCTLWLLNTTLYIQRNKNNEAMPLSLYWTEISLIQQAEVRTWHVLSHKGFFFLPHSLEFSICLTLSMFFFVFFTCVIMPRHSSRTWAAFDMISSGVLFIWGLLNLLRHEYKWTKCNCSLISVCRYCPSK